MQSLRVEKREKKSFKPNSPFLALTQRIFSNRILPNHPARSISTQAATEKKTPEHAPEVSEWPHLEVLDLHTFFLLRQLVVLARSPPSSRRWGVGFRLGRYGCGEADVVAIDLLLVLS